MQLTITALKIYCLHQNVDKFAQGWNLIEVQQNWIMQGWTLTGWEKIIFQTLIFKFQSGYFCLTGWLTDRWTLIVLEKFALRTGNTRTCWTSHPWESFKLLNLPTSPKIKSQWGNIGWMQFIRDQVFIVQMVQSW